MFPKGYTQELFFGLNSKKISNLVIQFGLFYLDFKIFLPTTKN